METSTPAPVSPILPTPAQAPEATAVARRQAPREDVVIDVDAWKDSRQCGHLATLAERFSKSSLVPPHFVGKPNDVFLVLQLAASRKLEPLQALQNIAIVKGKPFMSATYQIALANNSGIFKGRIKFSANGAGEKLAVTAYATLAETDEEISATASMEMAKAEGWTTNPKYQSMPQQMLSYRAATLLIRLYAPDALLGMTDHDDFDVIDVQPKQLGPKN
jgi:hypothetical protein